MRRIAMLLGLAVFCGAGCGGTSAKILERVDGGVAPTGTNPRVDAFLLRSVSTCAIGRACPATDSSQCFNVADSTGPRISFDPNTVRFVRTTDPTVATAERVQCFKMVLEDPAAVRDLFTGLRSSVYQASGGTINLDVRIHEINDNVDAYFIPYYTGLFLEPGALETIGLGLLSRDTDFVYAITGFRDLETMLQPTVDSCSGTNWFMQGVLGASPYTWMAMTNSCVKAPAFIGTFMIQAYFAMRDVANIGRPSTSPACGDGDPDPHTWFPSTSDCTRDPDAPTCGLASCPDMNTFYGHVLTTHWPRSTPFNGNYCADGRMDFDETGIDTGGVCDLIGR